MAMEPRSPLEPDQCPACGSRNTTSHTVNCRNPACRWAMCSACNVTYDPVTGRHAVTVRRST